MFGATLKVQGLKILFQIICKNSVYCVRRACNMLFCLFKCVLQYKFVIIDKIDFIIIQKSNVYGCFRCFVYFKTYVQRQAVRAQCAYILRNSN